MENATRALIMAASVILGVLLLATLVYVFRIGGNVSKTYDETQLTYQTEAFNYQFEVYQKDDNNIMNMITLLNLAYSTNKENDYDLNNSVVIILHIGNKTYQIPKDLSTDKEAFYNNNFKALERNKVYESSSNVIVSVYDLINKTCAELGITAGFIDESSDKLSKIHIGEYLYYPDSSSTPVKGTNGTTYKYLFDCDDDKLTYNDSTGRISRMEFTCKKNELWELGLTSEEWD